MKQIIFILIMLLITPPSFAHTIHAITEDDKQVILYSDGTWKYAEENTVIGDKPVTFIVICVI